MYYYDRCSDLELAFDAERDGFRLRQLYHETPDRMGYLPSYKNYSVIAPDFLNPLASDYWERKQEYQRSRHSYKPFDTRHALANDILEEKRRRITPRTEMPYVPSMPLRKQREDSNTPTINCPGYKSKDIPRVSVIGSASSSSAASNLATSARPPPPSQPSQPDFYVVRAKTPSSSSPSSSAEAVKSRLPVDIVAVRGGRGDGGGGGGKSYAGRQMDAASSMYYTDSNYPDHFWESATSIRDMIKKD